MEYDTTPLYAPANHMAANTGPAPLSGHTPADNKTALPQGQAAGTSTDSTALPPEIPAPPHKNRPGFPDIRQ